MRSQNDKTVQPGASRTGSQPSCPKAVRQKGRRTCGQGPLALELRAIDELDRSACLERWHAAFGRPPPKHLSLPFIRRVLVWEHQTRCLGGVSRQTQTTLQTIAAGKPAMAKAKTGAHLVREWNGRTYQVEVVESGYVMDGKTWRSLSAIARHITGAHWSGPRFFGVQS